MCQQLMIAASAWYLAQVITRFQSGEGFLAPLALYLVAMIAPYLPGCLSFVTLQWWVNRVHQQIIGNMVAAITGQVA